MITNPSYGDCDFDKAMMQTEPQFQTPSGYGPDEDFDLPGMGVPAPGSLEYNGQNAAPVQQAGDYHQAQQHAGGGLQHQPQAYSDNAMYGQYHAYHGNFNAAPMYHSPHPHQHHQMYHHQQYQQPSHHMYHHQPQQHQQQGGVDQCYHQHQVGGQHPSGQQQVPGQHQVSVGGRSPGAGSTTTPSPHSDHSVNDGCDQMGPVGNRQTQLKRPSPDSLLTHAIDSTTMCKQQPPPAKKPKVSKRKKKRDPNEPQKPVSAYALFFRDTQAAIKARNPNASFGEVSKLVASMWDSLDPDAKSAYKKRTETAKKEYLRQLAAYRATLVSNGSSDAFNGYTGPYGPYGGSGGAGMVHPSQGVVQSIPPRPPMQQHMAHQLGHPHQQQQHMAQQSYHHQQQQHPGYMGPGGARMMTPASQQQAGVPSPSSPSVTDSSPQHSPIGFNSVEQNQQQLAAASVGRYSAVANPAATAGRQGTCRRPGCGNPVGRGGREWGADGEYCSNECVVGQCREVFQSWNSGATPNNPVNTAGQAAPVK